MFKTSVIQATVNNFDMDDLFTSDPWSRKKDQKVKTEFDLLVLSSALYRLRTTAPKDQSNYHIHTMSLTDSQLSSHVIEADYVLADTIKEHFGQKLLMLQLKAARLTSFREDLNSFLHNNWHDPAGVFVYPDNFVNMVYKLPYLYDYDMKMREVFDTDYQDIVGPQNVKGQKTLTHIKTIKPVRKHSNSIEYWFSDDRDNRVMIPVEKHNPLMSVFDSLIKNPIDVKGKFEMRMKDTLQYYSMPLWEVVI